MSGLTVVTPPGSEPVALDDAKAHLRVTGTDEDGPIAGYLSAARSHVENYLGRALITRALLLKLDCAWPKDTFAPRIVLPSPPLVVVSAITYVDAGDGTTKTLASNQYLVSGHNGAGVVVPAFGVTWPSVRNLVDVITVAFTAGYGTAPANIPESIRQAVLLMLGHLYENRAASVVGVPVADLPLGVTALLSSYRLEVL